MFPDIPPLRFCNILRMVENLRELQQFNVGEDCPVFEGLYVPHQHPAIIFL